MSKEKNPDFVEIVALISEAKSRVFANVNAELVQLYWQVGSIVSKKLESGQWGENIVGELASFIDRNYPSLKGFNRRGLYRMRQFFDTYKEGSDVRKQWLELNKGFATSNNSANVSTVSAQTLNHESFVTTVLTQISWSSHLHILSKTKTAEEKIFYLLIAIKDRLSVRELERQISTSLYERTNTPKAISPILKEGERLPLHAFKDPYIFEFLDLPEIHSETDLEQALILNLQKFILEIGKGFAYMGRQHRLQVGNKDYYTDLLFYNRDLQCLVLFELKIEEFKPEFLGKLNFYLEALDRDVKRDYENPTIGILLCKGKDSEVVEYAMARNTSPAIIADYETKLIDKKLLAAKLEQLIVQLSKSTEN